MDFKNSKARQGRVFRHLWQMKIFFTFWECSTYLSHNIGFCLFYVMQFVKTTDTKTANNEGHRYLCGLKIWLYFETAKKRWDVSMRNYWEL